MIFVTVGTQLPFERLIRTVDAWAAKHPETQVFIQSGETTYQPKHCECETHTTPEQWEQLFQQAEVVVSHAGMGTILKSLDYTKPLIIMPRLAALGEHRNDHQVATASRFNSFSNVKIANTEEDLLAMLDEPFDLPQDGKQENVKLQSLLSAIQDFVHEYS